MSDGEVEINITWEIGGLTMVDNTCCVCGGTDNVKYRNSSCGPITLSYCENCLGTYREPYRIVVAYLSGSGITDKRYVADWFKRVIKDTLEFYEKDEDQLFEDAKAAYEEFMAYRNTK